MTAGKNTDQSFDHRNTINQKINDTYSNEDVAAMESAQLKNDSSYKNATNSMYLLMEDMGDYFLNNDTIGGGVMSLLDYPVLNCSNLTLESNAGCVPNNFSSNFKEEVEEHSNNYWPLILVLIPILTLFGNVLVILAVYRERTLQSVTNYFIVSLAIADLLVAVLVMPFAVYVLVNGKWSLPGFVCDFYIAMDVTCSTSSIFNLVAISIDRYIAVTQPIKYAKHKNGRRVWLTIVLVWGISVAIGSPIVLGLNNTPDRLPDLCLFYNSDFIIYSSLSSFYIPCIMMVFLYYNIFKALRNRARKQRAARKPHLSEIKPGSVIENLATTRRLAETTLGPVLVAPATTTLDEERPTNTGSGSQEEEEDIDKDEASPGSEDNCHVIANNKSADFILATVVEETAVVASLASPAAADPNGNNDSGYAASNVEETGIVVVQPSVPSSPRGAGAKNVQPAPPQEPDASTCKVRKNGATPAKEAAVVIKNSPPVNRQAVKAEDDTSTSLMGSKKERKATTGSRFTIYKVNKASRKKREKSSAKKERKATKTLAIVLGVFLICWVPFFTCNIMDAMCTKLSADCSPGVTAFILTTWLGYMNSFVNPVIYTIFNPEFRKAFKKLMSVGT